VRLHIFVCFGVKKSSGLIMSAILTIASLSIRIAPSREASASAFCGCCCVVVLAICYDSSSSALPKILLMFSMSGLLFSETGSARFEGSTD